MAAKGLVEWEVICVATNEAAANEIVEQLGGKAFATIRKKTCFVCPHCGEPWPRIEDGGDALTEAEYAYMVDVTHPCNQTGQEQNFCCDATRDDCKVKVGDGS